MANGHGGARPGAGRPRKPLADKILEDTTKKHKPKILDMPEFAGASDKPPEWMPYYGSKTAGRPDAPEIYETVVQWLKQTGCLHLVNPMYITDFAIVKASWYEAQRMITQYGLVYSPPAEDGKSRKAIIENPMSEAVSRYFKMSQQA